MKIKSNQLKRGISVEGEHKRTYDFIKNYFKKHGRFPERKTFFKKIALEHLKEDPNYYTKLKLVERRK